MDYVKQKTVNGLKEVPKKDGSKMRKCNLGEGERRREGGIKGFQDFTAI